jgi:hypothetical protein
MQDRGLHHQPVEGFALHDAAAPVEHLVGDSDITSHRQTVHEFAIDRGAREPGITHAPVGELRAQALIGLGPGLTPSGDDYFGGVLIALHQFGRQAQAHSLWRWLKQRLSRTSDISAAHLEAAASGEGHEALHRCIEALCRVEAEWDGALAALDKVGHCSGWDSLAGVVAVARLT